MNILNTSGKSITVRGQGQSHPYRIFTISAAQEFNVSNLTIANGAAVGNNSGDQIGGGILNNGGSLTLTNVTLSGNYSFGFGGAVASIAVDNFSSAPLTIINSTISGNGATATSGLVVSFAASPNSVCTVSGSTVHIAGVGSCTVMASQGGDSNFNAASSAPSTSRRRRRRPHSPPP